MRRRRSSFAIAVGGLAVAVVAVAGACSSFNAAAPGVADAASESAAADGAIAADAVADAPAPTDAGVPDADAGPANLLKNADFELPSCAQWDVSSATKSDIDGGRTGSACRVCGTDAEIWYLRQKVPVAAKPGEVYLAEAWISFPLEGPATLVAVSLVLDDVTQGGLMGAQGDDLSPSATWTSTHIALTVEVDGGAGLDFTVKSSHAGGCFFVDDARLTKIADP